MNNILILPPFLVLAFRLARGTVCRQLMKEVYNVRSDRTLLR